MSTADQPECNAGCELLESWLDLILPPHILTGGLAHRFGRHIYTHQVIRGEGWANVGKGANLAGPGSPMNGG